VRTDTFSRRFAPDAAGPGAKCYAILAVSTPMRSNLARSGPNSPPFRRPRAKKKIPPPSPPKSKRGARLRGPRLVFRPPPPPPSPPRWPHAYLCNGRRFPAGCGLALPPIMPFCLLASAPGNVHGPREPPRPRQVLLPFFGVVCAPIVAALPPLDDLKPCPLRLRHGAWCTSYACHCATHPTKKALPLGH
jgi:hypothetical protein